MRNSFVIFTLVLTVFSGCRYQEVASSDLQNYESHYGLSDKAYQIQMILGDFGGLSTETLNTNAYPLKLAVAALVLKDHRETNSPISRETYLQKMQSFGFYVPQKISNLEPSIHSPDWSLPAGIVRGTLHFDAIPGIVDPQVEIANISCVACHGGVTYDKTGLPTREMWFGSPNTSVNIGGYVNEVYASFKQINGHEGEVMSAMRTLFPEMSEAESTTMSLGVIPYLEAQIERFRQNGDDIIGYDPGPPGSANALGAFKRVLGLIPHYGTSHGESGFVSIPDMAYRGLKTNLTVDGTYTIPEEKSFSPKFAKDVTDAHFNDMGVIAALFPIAVQGVLPARTEGRIPAITQTVGAFFKSYRPPPFPGDIDPDTAARGEALFQNHCQACHGQYENYAAGARQLALVWYPNKLIPLAAIGTDPARIALLTEDLRKALLNTWIGQRIETNVSDGYMPPILSGLWFSAPYLHNESVPTLWQLMNPELRAQKFYVGGHRLDFQSVGIAGSFETPGLYTYPKNYSPWATPVLVDTELSGRSNKGHEKPFADLSTSQKKDLLEYLKLL